MPAAASWYGRFRRNKMIRTFASCLQWICNACGWTSEDALASFLQLLCLCNTLPGRLTCLHDRQKGRINYAKPSHWSPLAFIHFAQSIGILGISPLHKIKQEGGFSCILASIHSLPGGRTASSCLSGGPAATWGGLIVTVGSAAHRQCLF